jgi:hypothetical protein
MDIENLTEVSQNQRKSFASESFEKLIRKKEVEIISYRKDSSPSHWFHIGLYGTRNNFYLPGGIKLLRLNNI